MFDLNEMTADDFSTLEGSQFSIASLDPSTSLTLVEVKKMGQGERKGGAFSILLQGPTEPILPQSIYALTHDAMGTNDIFLVPVAQKDAGIQYEAVFT